MRRFTIVVAACTILAAGCRDEDVSVPIGDGTGEPDSAELARARYDTAWQLWAERDHAGRPAHATGDSAATDSLAAAVDGAMAASALLAPGEEATLDAITPAAVNRRARLPVGGDDVGPAVLHVQILLDRAGFSPGILDGRWGKNTAKAVYWFRHARGLEPARTADEATYRLLHAHSPPGKPAVRYAVTEEDLAGPFVSIPDGVYEKAELGCMCYESPMELLAEKFHSTPDLLERLNPDVDFAALEAGALLWVPNVRTPERDSPQPIDAARIVVSRNGYYTQALDADGEILLHFPSTLGSRYDPSPTGDYRVVAITRDPHFHYQPALFHEVPDTRRDTMLPPGPNSPVGVVWMALSKPHYGIHGTSAPETIGYVSSHGCIRLTNWDARALADRVGEDTPVEFR